MKIFVDGLDGFSARATQVLCALFIIAVVLMLLPLFTNLIPGAILFVTRWTKIAPLAFNLPVLLIVFIGVGTILLVASSPNKSSQNQQ